MNFCCPFVELLVPTKISDRKVKFFILAGRMFFINYLARTHYYASLVGVKSVSNLFATRNLPVPLPNKFNLV